MTKHAALTTVARVHARVGLRTKAHSGAARRGTTICRAGSCACKVLTKPGPSRSGRQGPLPPLSRRRESMRPRPKTSASMRTDPGRGALIANRPSSVSCCRRRGADVLAVGGHPRFHRPGGLERMRHVVLLHAAALGVDPHHQRERQRRGRDPRPRWRSGSAREGADSHRPRRTHRRWAPSRPPPRRSRMYRTKTAVWKMERSHHLLHEIRARGHRVEPHPEEHDGAPVGVVAEEGVKHRLSHRSRMRRTAGSSPRSR